MGGREAADFPMLRGHWSCQQDGCYLHGIHHLAALPPVYLRLLILPPVHPQGRVEQWAKKGELKENTKIWPSLTQPSLTRPLWRFRKAAFIHRALGTRYADRRSSSWTAYRLTLRQRLWFEPGIILAVCQAPGAARLYPSSDSFSKTLLRTFRFLIMFLLSHHMVSQHGFSFCRSDFSVNRTSIMFQLQRRRA